MTLTTVLSRINRFSREQLEAINEILLLLDSEEFRDYHNQFGVCNAPDTIERLQAEVQRALDE